MPIFTEIQRPRQSWLFLVIVLIALAGWAMFLQQIVRGKPFGDDPLPDWGVWVLAALLGVVLPLFFLWFKLETTVYPDRVELRMSPFMHRIIRSSEIAGAAARPYRPMREYGGWGIRGWGGNKAYNISGNQGVQLVLTNGHRVLIGTQRPKELAAAIDSMVTK